MKTQKITTYLLSTTILLMGMACTEKNELPDGPGKITLNDKSKELVKADNEFGLSMFKAIAADETEENFMVSPLSISLAMGMAYNGAEGNTRTQMEEAMKLTGLTREEINVSYQSLVNALLEVDPKVVMEVANSIWHKQNFNVKADYLQINQTYYNAEVTSKDFANPQTVTDINQWVSDKTHGKITEIIDNISPEMVMYLINAIYFNGTWSKEFNKASTIDWSFSTEAGEQVIVDGMSRKDTVGYFSNSTFRAIDLPYGGGNYQMMLMLPKTGHNVADITSMLSPKNWLDWQNELSKNTKAVLIMLPRFEFSYEITLNKVLQDLGIQDAFTEMANFTSITTDGGIAISKVKHKTYIKTNEEGTEAAAVTSIGFFTTSAGPNEEPEFEPFFCDHPFLFAIVEKDTDAIVFLGKVGKPEKKE